MLHIVSFVFLSGEEKRWKVIVQHFRKYLLIYQELRRGDESHVKSKYEV